MWLRTVTLLHIQQFREMNCHQIRRFKSGINFFNFERIGRIYILVTTKMRVKKDPRKWTKEKRERGCKCACVCDWNEIALFTEWMRANVSADCARKIHTKELHTHVTEANVFNVSLHTLTELFHLNLKFIVYYVSCSIERGQEWNEWDLVFDSVCAEWKSNERGTKKHKFIAVHYKGKHTGNFGGCIWTTSQWKYIVLPALLHILESAANHYLFFAHRDVVIYYKCTLSIKSFLIKHEQLRP